MDWWQIYGVWVGVIFGRVNRDDGAEEMLYMVWMKVCENMDWDFLPLRNEEVPVVAERERSHLVGLNYFLLDVINHHYF